MITFLTKSFINKLTAHLAAQIHINNVNEVKQLGSFSTEVYFTHDILATEQLALCVRNVQHGEMKIRFLKLIHTLKQ